MGTPYRRRSGLRRASSIVFPVTALATDLLLEYGILGVDTGLISTEVTPFGGVKESGICREGSSFDIDDWVELKHWAIGGLGEPL